MNRGTSRNGTRKKAKGGEKLEKWLITAIVVVGLLAAPMVYATEFYDPLPDEPGKFMGPHGPKHTHWHYHGPEANEDAHCEAALEDPIAPEGVYHFCETHAH
jgi:hypothetical protein